jgi:glucokinase
VADGIARAVGHSPEDATRIAAVAAGVGRRRPLGVPIGRALEDASQARIGAVDVGATKTCVAVVSVPLLRWDLACPVVEFQTPRDPTVLADAVAAALTALSPVVVPLVLGIAAPGPLDPATGVVIHSPNLDWRNVPLGALLAARTGARVLLDDDANLGALGEAALGAGVGADPIAYLTVSTGIGAGIVIGGQVIGGAHRAAGEVGHLTVDRAGPYCGCGRRGHVEAYAGGAGLARRARATWTHRWLPDGSPAPRTAIEILSLAQRGDPAARVLVEEAAAALASAFAVLAAILDPEMIVVGGSIGLGQPGLIRAAVARARRLPIRQAGDRLKVVRAALGDASPLAGAAVLAARMGS